MASLREMPTSCCHVSSAAASMPSPVMPPQWPPALSRIHPPTQKQTPLLPLPLTPLLPLPGWPQGPPAPEITHPQVQMKTALLPPLLSPLLPSLQTPLLLPLSIGADSCL